MPKMRELLEPQDVATACGISVATVRTDVLKGHLTPMARTRRGVRLFTADQAEAYRLGRAERGL